MPEGNSEQRLAVLIDADNVSYTHIKPMMEEVARYGKPTIKRIYGDWTKPNLSGWKALLLENAIIPVQQYGYTTGKNSTDSAMIIDAMDILYSDRVDGFCIVSSDSDFTRLATRLREAGKGVIGIGEKKTPEPFIAACDRFVYFEILESEQTQPEKSDGPAKQAHQKQSNQVPKAIITLIRASVNDVADEDGWAFCAEVGNLILRKQPSFDPRNYGYTKLTPLIKSLGIFDIDYRDTANRGIKHVFIKDRNFEGGKK